jgi:hypothetical protein
MHKLVMSTPLEQMGSWISFILSATTLNSCIFATDRSKPSSVWPDHFDHAMGFGGEEVGHRRDRSKHRSGSLA